MIVGILIVLVSMNISSACEFNNTHCTCMFSSDTSLSRCYRPVTETTCLVEECVAAYKCDCAGSEICDVGSCGAWRADIATEDTPGTIVDCHYAEASSAEAARCLGGPVAAASLSSTPSSLASPTASSSSTLASSSPSAVPSTAASASASLPATATASTSAAASVSSSASASTSASFSASASASTAPSTTPTVSGTPSVSPIVAQCPGNEATFRMIDHIDAAYTYNSPGTVNYPSTGQSLSIFGAGINQCNLYPVPEAPDGNAPNAWKLRAEFSGINGECATTGTSSRIFGNYVVYGIETDGTFYIQPSIEVFDVDNQYLFSNLLLWNKYPKELIGMVGFRNGEIIYPTLTIASGSTILETRTYEMAAGDVLSLGEAGGALNVPTLSVLDNSNSSCTVTNWNTCTGTFTFNEPISKLWVIGSATYDAPALALNKIDIGVNPFQFAC